MNREGNTSAFSRERLSWFHVLCVDQLDDWAKLFQLWRFLGESLVFLDQVWISLQRVDDRGSSSPGQDGPSSQTSSGLSGKVVAIHAHVLMIVDWRKPVTVEGLWPRKVKVL